MPLSFAADCERCTGLCCVALPFQASADFPESKPAGRPCRHLGPDARCAIHADLPERGWHGCVAFHCAGAGPHLVHTTYGGLPPGGAEGPTDPDEPGTAEEHAAFRGLLEVFEVGYYVAEAAELTAPVGRVPDPGLTTRLAAAAEVVERAAALPPAVLATYDAAPLRALAGPLLRATASRVREATEAGGRLSRESARITAGAPGADLAGRDLRGVDLRGADLSGALLLGADLRGADLSGACLLGADLRGCRPETARLAEALFLPPARRPGRPDDDGPTYGPGHPSR